MKFIFKKIYIILILVVLIQTNGFTRDNKILYTGENISNYFSGIVASKKYDNKRTYNHLKKVKELKDDHFQYNMEFLKTLVLLEKFDKAFKFSESVWKENELFFEGDLLLGLNSFLNKDYKNSERYFKRLNLISRQNLYFDNFIGNVLIAWSKAAQGKKEESFEVLKKIPRPYMHLQKTQEGFLKCYFDGADTQAFFEEIIQTEDYNFSRYNFFLANYFLHNENEEEALKIIEKGRKKNGSILLLEETENFLKIGKDKKIKNFFNCKNPKDSLAEFFYIIANLYSSEDKYRLSNFYLKVSKFLNEKFLPNQTLLAENLYYQNKLELSKDVYNDLKLIGEAYSWHASKSIASILLEKKGKEYAVKKLEEDLNSIKEVNFKHHYEMANFYKDNKYYKESIKYYSIALKRIKNDNSLIPKILYRRGTSYERIGNWEDAEKDLIKSLKIEPDQAQVMNYLAYSWVDKGINIDKGLEMLMKANLIEGGEDGYIIDSLGWAYYAKKDYVKAEKFLQAAVELLPRDPIIHDHYADNLWMMNKTIQARYIWSSILTFDTTEQKLKDQVGKKIIFGIDNKL